MIHRVARQLTPTQAPIVRRIIGRAPAHLQRTWTRNSSAQPSPQTQFYKTFGRPIAKVFLMAVFTYQVAYYLWVRLEHGEIRREMQATISDLEARVEQLEKGRKR